MQHKFDDLVLLVRLSVQKGRERNHRAQSLLIEHRTHVQNRLDYRHSTGRDHKLSVFVLQFLQHRHSVLKTSRHLEYCVMRQRAGEDVNEDRN